jgi:YD repeat-containing protein
MPHQYEVLKSVTDPLSHVPYSVVNFDSNGNPLTIADGNGNVWTYTYNSAGQVLTASDPMTPPDIQTYAYNAAGTSTLTPIPTIIVWQSPLTT